MYTHRIFTLVSTVLKHACFWVAVGNQCCKPTHSAEKGPQAKTLELDVGTSSLCGDSTAHWPHWAACHWLYMLCTNGKVPAGICGHLRRAESQTKKRKNSLCFVWNNLLHAVHGGESGQYGQYCLHLKFFSETAVNASSVTTFQIYVFCWIVTVYSLCANRDRKFWSGWPNQTQQANGVNSWLNLLVSPDSSRYRVILYKSRKYSLDRPRGNADMILQTIQMHVFDCGRKPESGEKAHADLWAFKLHTEKALSSQWSINHHHIVYKFQSGIFSLSQALLEYWEILYIKTPKWETVLLAHSVTIQFYAISGIKLLKMEVLMCVCVHVCVARM